MPGLIEAAPWALLPVVRVTRIERVRSVAPALRMIGDCRLEIRSGAGESVRK